MRRQPDIRVSSRPPRRRDIVAPERDVESGRPRPADREQKQRQRSDGSGRAKPRRWAGRNVALVGVGLGVVAVAGLAAVAVSGGGADDDAAANEAAATTPLGGAAASVAPGDTAGSIASPDSSSGGSATTEADGDGGGAGVAGPIGAGTYDAVATVTRWEWLQLPDPRSGEILPMGDVLTRNVGDTDDSPSQIVLVGDCDGVGPCRLEERNGSPTSVIAGYSFFSADLEPIDGGYRASRPRPDDEGGDCTMSDFVHEIELAPTPSGWVGSAVWRMVYSSHGPVTDLPDGGYTFTVCDGIDFASSFVLTKTS